MEFAALRPADNDPALPSQLPPPRGSWRGAWGLLLVVAVGVVAALFAVGDVQEEEDSAGSLALPNLTKRVELPPLTEDDPGGRPQLPRDIPKEERGRRKNASKTASCVGNVLGASVFEAGLALELQAAFLDCAEARRFARELAAEKEEEEKYVKDLPSWEEILRRLHRRRHGDNGTRAAEATTTSPKQELQEATKRQELKFLRAKCARDVASVLRDISVITRLAAQALQNCGGQKTDCAKFVAATMQWATSLAQTGGDLALACPAKLKDAPDSIVFRDLDICAEQLERVGWESGGLFGAISKAEESCNDIEERGNPLYDELSCAGNIVASVSYVGAAGLWLTAAIQRDCVLGRAVRKLDKEALKQEVGPEEYELLMKRLDQEKAECARDISGFVRTLGLAAWKGTRAAGWCGGFNSDCGVNVLQSATGLFGASEASARTRLNCFRAELQEEPLDREVGEVKCAVSSAALVKELAVVAAFAIDARNSCPNTTFAAVECGSRIAKTLAVLAYLTERSALAQRFCTVEDNTFVCGRALDDIGQAVNLLPSAIGGAVVNCGLGLFPRITKPLRLPRRFWVPS